ncbi:MAG: type II toxin-antitoxin system RelE/ParE family toxin [Alphaproteobacteria bacterium]|nr:MAG: type II toxin-antitoxin system RelE/ParE family toxin [Alphaproteobacteria bacterium]
MTYKFVWDKKTKKDLRNIDAHERDRIIKKCNEILTKDPKIGSQLVGYHGLRRIRVGDYRIIYSIYEEIVTVRIIKI